MSRNNINTNLAGAEAFIDLTDTPKEYAGAELLYCQVNSTGTGLQFASASGSGVTKFTELNDCPASYVGQANKQVVVNPGETGLQFVNNGAGVTKFIECTDTPLTYTGTNSFDIVNVTTGHNAVQFTSLNNLAGFVLPLESLMNTPAVNPPGGQVLTSTGTGNWVGSVINFNSLVNNLDVLDTFTNDIVLGTGASNIYYVDLNYTTQNDGFTLTLPNLFKPSINLQFNISWTFHFRLAKTTGTAGGVLITLSLYDSFNNVIDALDVRNYPVSTMIAYPSYDTYTITGNKLITLNSTTQYKFKIECDCSGPTSIHYNKNNKHFITSGKVSTNIIDNEDYLSVGYPPGVMICNGEDGFNVVNGVNNDVLQVVNNAPVWVPLGSAQIPDPLLINNINERTLNHGVVINNNTKITTGGILYPNNTAFIGGSLPTTMNTYYNSISVNAFWTDSNTLLPIGTTPAIAYYSKIGQLVFITVGNFASTTNFLNASSYPTLSNIVMNGPTIPISTSFRQPFVYNNNGGGNNRTDAYIEYEPTSRYFFVKSTARSDGGLNGGGFAHDQFTLCFLGSS